MVKDRNEPCTLIQVRYYARINHIFLITSVQVLEIVADIRNTVLLLLLLVVMVLVVLIVVVL